jgi:hypothetical protein
VTEALEGKVEELSNKYSGAMDDLKKAQRELRAAKDITPEAHQAEIDRADKAEAALAEVNKQVKALTTERDKAVKDLQTEQAHTSKLLISDGLKSALIANGVKDEDFIDTLTAKFATGASIKVDGENRIAMLGDKGLADAIKEWAGSDAGKKFVAAPQNSGGGAAGGGGASGGKTILRSQFDALSPAEQMATIKGGAKVVDAAA